MFRNRALQILLMLAVSSLVLNDVARLSFPDVFAQVSLKRNNSGSGEENNNPTNTLFEEEVKHKEVKERVESLLIVPESELDATIAHLIADDDVRHLAYMPIFSPPPNQA